MTIDAHVHSPPDALADTLAFRAADVDVGIDRACLSNTGSLSRGHSFLRVGAKTPRRVA
jgi:hypothetical protein